jgi:hypothetical protein
MFHEQPLLSKGEARDTFRKLTGCPHHDSGAATGSCNVRGEISRVSSVAVQPSGAM